MKANQAYFYRNKGEWDWKVQFDLTSWSKLWNDDISFFSKSCLSILVMIQQIFGPLQMWTSVDFQKLTTIARHQTKMKKWGLTIYRSEKTFYLDENGFDLRLEGKEFYWPFSFIGFSFDQTFGRVDATTTRAVYQMPMAGTKCECRAYLELPLGHIDIEAPWIKGHFTLTETSNNILKERFT